MLRVVTDTAADITIEEAEQLNVDLVQIDVMFGKEPYEGLADVDFAAFYERLAASKDLPSTSQPSPASYLTIFTHAKKMGDEVLVVCLSSGLSGTFQSALIAADMADYDAIYVVDSRSAVIGQRLLVEYAVKLRTQGLSAAEIAAILNDARGRVHLFGAIDTLKYLRKGGRIPKSAEMLGSVMGIKPLVRINSEGRIVMAGKTRGHAGAVTGMLKLIGRHTDFDAATPFYFGYTRDAQHCLNFKKLCMARLHLNETAVHPVGPVVGTHIGPGAFAVAYLAKTPTED